MYTHSMKYLLIVLILTGCAGPRLDMTTFQADCRWAQYQMTLLETSLSDYQRQGMNDYDYYQQLKNNIWSLRSTCRAYRS